MYFCEKSKQTKFQVHSFWDDQNVMDYNTSHLYFYMIQTTIKHEKIANILYDYVEIV